MTVDLAALAKLASEATPGPWVQGRPPMDMFSSKVRTPEGGLVAQAWGWERAMEDDNAAYIAAASPDVVLALVRVALAARAGPADNEPDCTCDRDDDSDPGGALTLCPKHERMMRPLRWETLAMMVIDLMANEAALRAALADLDR